MLKYNIEIYVFILLIFVSKKSREYNNSYKLVAEISLVYRLPSCSNTVSSNAPEFQYRIMNLRLFFLLVIIESLCVVGGFFGLILFFFLYFGSGAGASSDKAMLTENMAFVILFLLPLLFGIFKYRNLTEELKAKSYLYSGLLVTIVSGIYFGLNM